MSLSLKSTIAKSIAAGSGAAASGSAMSALWTFPAVLGSAVVISWGAEAAQFLISQGMALAILAWLQTLPEFAVEAVIAWEAGKDPERVHLAIANFTGSLRLLVGLGWPMIYAVAAIAHRRSGKGPLREIVLEGHHAVEVLGLLPCIAYFCIPAAKGCLSIVDTVILTVLYFSYLWLLNHIPPEEEEGVDDIDAVPRWVLRQRTQVRNACIVGLFLAGGLLLFFVAHPFLESMLALALAVGINEFVFVQWVAPFLSEFPEKVSAFKWALKRKAPMALMNMVSSNINQWTMLAAMIPIAFSLSRGSLAPLPFDDFQVSEITLTIVQSLLGFLLLANMRFSWHEALLLFVLWLAQFLWAAIRIEIAMIYLAWCTTLSIRMMVGWRTFRVLPEFMKVMRDHVTRR